MKKACKPQGALYFRCFSKDSILQLWNQYHATVSIQRIAYSTLEVPTDNTRWWFQPIGKIKSNWSISPSRGKNKQYLKPTPRLVCICALNEARLVPGLPGLSNMYRWSMPQNCWNWKQPWNRPACPEQEVAQEFRKETMDDVAGHRFGHSFQRAGYFSCQLIFQRHLKQTSTLHHPKLRQRINLKLSNSNHE